MMMTEMPTAMDGSGDADRDIDGGGGTGCDVNNSQWCDDGTVVNGDVDNNGDDGDFIMMIVK